MQGDTKCMQCLSCMHILYTRITIEILRHLYVTDQRTLAPLKDLLKILSLNSECNFVDHSSCYNSSEFLAMKMISEGYHVFSLIWAKIFSVNFIICGGCIIIYIYFIIYINKYKYKYKQEAIFHKGEGSCKTESDKTIMIVMVEMTVARNDE